MGLSKNFFGSRACEVSILVRLYTSLYRPTFTSVAKRLVEAIFDDEEKPFVPEPGRRYIVKVFIEEEES